MNDLAATRRSYDRVAARYAAEVGDELAHKPLDRALLDALLEQAGTGPVADLGCGPGHVAGYLAQRSATVIGLDLSPAMCAAARSRIGPVVAAADLAALPLAAGSLSALVCWYALIHLDADQRAAAYAEFARVLRPGGQACIAFHTRDADTATGHARVLREWWDAEVALTFRFLDPDAETRALAAAGLRVTARLERSPVAEFEHASDRCYLVATVS